MNKHFKYAALGLLLALNSCMVWSEICSEEVSFSPAHQAFLQTVQVTEGSTIQVGAVKTLFPLKDFQTVGIAPDGKRFLAVHVPKIDPPAQIVVVQNWMDELKRLLPVQ